MAVRVLHAEHLRLRSAVSGGGAAEGFFFSQRMIGSSGAPSAAVSPRDNYASLRRENRELKLEISRMRVRLSDLEKEQALMKRGGASKDHHHRRRGDHRRDFFSSISRGIGLFGASRAAQSPKSAAKPQPADGKNWRRRRD